MTQSAYSAQQQVNEALADGVHQQPDLSFNQQTLPTICPKCNNMILPNFKFCPNCGRQIGGISDISVGRQIYIYIMSAALPPLGLYWGIKYIFNPKTKIKIIGTVAALLTIVSLIITVKISLGFFSQIQSLYQGLPSGKVPTSVSNELQLLK